MCLGIPGEVVEIVDPVRQLVKVDFAGVAERSTMTC